MVELTYTDVVINLIGIVFVTFIATMFFYYRGYYHGYKAGADYGMSKVNEYHKYTMDNITQMKKDVRGL